MAFTYILKCNDGKFYIGSTINLGQRIREHRAGKCKFTKSRLPVEIIFTEEFSSYSKARKREYQIKNKKSRFAIEKLIKSKE